MRKDYDSPPAVIDRVADILDEFQGGGHLTLSELSGRTGLPRSSVHRLLTQLVDAGWVRREARTYALGRSMFEWGALAQHHDELHRTAHPVLHELHSATGLVAHLAVLDGHDVRYLDKVGRESVPLPSRVGGRQPAYRTALGKAMIAHTRLDPAGPDRMPIAESERLRGEIAQIRERQIAQEREESMRGVACIAAPIGNGRTCVGALSVTGDVDTVDVVQLATPVRVAARAVWNALSQHDTGSRSAHQRTSA